MNYTPFILLCCLLTLSCAKTDNANLAGKDLTLTAEEKQKVEQNNQFAFNLFKESAFKLQANENALLSPLSISTALAMTSNGARGETRAAIEKALNVDGFETASINAYYQKLVQDLPQLDPRTTLEIANSIWYRQDYTVLPDFLNLNSTFYHAQIAALDFNDPAAPGVINDWVNGRTQGKIPTIVEEISGNTMMYLINAIYFKGSWEQKFEEANTATSPFHRLDDAPLQTDFMHVNHRFKVASDDQMEAIELPYGHKKYSMVILKPKGEQTPRQLLDKYQEGDAWQSLIAGFNMLDVNLSLPKFKFSYERELKADLTKLGMGLAFRDDADFSGINGSGGLKIDEVMHKSFIEVNEEGTEAAAVTSVVMVLTSVPTTYQFKVDRPFLFVIREMSSGLILFIGQMNDPSVSEIRAD